MHGSRGWCSGHVSMACIPVEKWGVGVLSRGSVTRLSKKSPGKKTGWESKLGVFYLQLPVLGWKTGNLSFLFARGRP